MHKNYGFTLIELLVVITIIGIIAAIGLPSYMVANQKARDGRRETDIKSIQMNLETYRRENGVYPTTDQYASTAFTELFTDDKLPVDPKPASGCEYVYDPGADLFTYELSYCLERDESTDPVVVDNP